MLTDLRNYFTSRLNSKFAIGWRLKIPPPLKCVTTHVKPECSKIDLISKYTLTQEGQTQTHSSTRASRLVVPTIVTSQQLLPSICQISGEFFMFQHNSVHTQSTGDVQHYWVQNSCIDHARFVAAKQLWHQSSRLQWMIWFSVCGMEYNSTIGNASNHWCRRLRACIQAREGHFEYSLWQN